MQQQQSKGFTLLELLVAITIFAILATISYSSLSNVIRQQEASEKYGDKLKKLQLAVTMMQRDFSQITFQSSRDEYGTLQAPVSTRSDPDALLEFSRNGWHNPAKQMRSTQQRVSYYVEDDTLYRAYWPTLHRGPQMEPVEMALMENVLEAKLEFRDHNGNWHGDWPLERNNDSNKQQNPIQIRMELEFTDETLMELSFEIPKHLIGPGENPFNQENQNANPNPNANDDENQPQNGNNNVRGNNNNRGRPNNRNNE